MSRLTKVEVDRIEQEAQRIQRPAIFLGRPPVVEYYILTPDQFFRLTNGARALVESERELRRTATRVHLALPTPPEPDR